MSQDEQPTLSLERANELLRFKVEALQVLLKHAQKEQKKEEYEEEEVYYDAPRLYMLMNREIHKAKNIYKKKQEEERKEELEECYYRVANLREHRNPQYPREEGDYLVDKVRQEFEAVHRDGMSAIAWDMRKFK